MGGGERPLASMWVAAYLLLATGTQMLLALYGLLSRYVQVVAAPPIPALRLVVITNLIGEAAMVCLHLAPKLLLAALRRRRRHREQRRAADAGLPTPPAAPHAPAAAKPQAASHGVGSPNDTCSSSSIPGSQPLQQQQQQQQQQQPPPTGAPADAAAAAEAGRGTAAMPQLAHARSTVRAPVPLVRGLSRRVDRWEAGRPGLRRGLALGAITASFMGCCSLQILAPGFVDVSIVQLTTQWTTLGIALAQALLLRHRLPRVFWPCAAAMMAGACMVIIPSVGLSASGSLSTVRGWMGLLMAVGAWLSTVVYYILLQATRHMGFTPLQLQHCMNCLSIALFTALSLPIDGAAWAAQFAGWRAADWLALVALSTACYLGSGMLMQVCVWKLGAPTAAMFFGLRLVFAVALSTPILGSTIIQTGVQIAGVVLTAAAVTAYAGSQWWASRQAQRQPAAAAAPQQDKAAALQPPQP